MFFFSFPFLFPGIFGSDSLWFPFPKCGKRFFSFPSRSRILGIDFFIPFPFPNFGNGFFSFPFCSQIEGMVFFQFPSRSWTLGMELSIPVFVPELLNVIPAHSWLNWGLKTRFSDICARLPSSCVWNCSSCLIVQGLQQTYNAKIVLLGLQWSYNTTRRQRLFRPCLDFNCHTIQLEDKDSPGSA